MLDMHRVGNETNSMLKLKPCLKSHRRGGRGAEGEEEERKEDERRREEQGLD